MSGVPVGGRRPHTITVMQDIAASDVRVEQASDQVWVHLIGAGSLWPFGSDRHAQLAQLAAIGDAIFTQAMALLEELGGEVEGEG